MFFSCFSYVKATIFPQRESMWHLIEGGREGVQREWDEAASALVFNSMCPFTSKNALLFPELSFYFPELPFYLPELPFYLQVMLFCFLELPFPFPEKLFSFSKMPYCFPELFFSLPELLLFYYFLSVSFSKNAFFPADCTFSLSCSELLRAIIFALLLFCFLLELFIDQLMMLHLACAHIQAINKLQPQ